MENAQQSLICYICLSELKKKKQNDIFLFLFGITSFDCRVVTNAGFSKRSPTSTVKTHKSSTQHKSSVDVISSAGRQQGKKRHAMRPQVAQPNL